MNSLREQIEIIGINNEEKLFDLLKEVEAETANKNIDYLIQLLDKSTARWMINGVSLALSETTIRQEEVRHGLRK